MSNSSPATFPSIRCKLFMPCYFIRLLIIMVILATTFPQKSDGRHRHRHRQQFVEYCIADEQFSDEELQSALDWACGNGADCRRIRPHKPCFFPNTTKDHASFAFNSYYQRMKHKGGTCYFHAAALVTALDPSYDRCKFDYRP